MWPGHTPNRRRVAHYRGTSHFRTSVSYMSASGGCQAKPARCSSNSVRSSRATTTATCKLHGNSCGPTVGYLRAPCKARCKNSKTAVGSFVHARAGSTDAVCMRSLFCLSTATRNLIRPGITMARNARRQMTGKIRSPTPLIGVMGNRTAPLIGASDRDCPAHRGSHRHFRDQTAPLIGDL